MAKKKLKVVKGAKTDAKATSKEAPKKAAKKAGTRKFSGKTTGLGVTAFQNQLMAKNYKAKLTDTQLAKAMRDEFPSATAYTVAHVVGIRSAYNNGKHGNEAPEKKLPRFDEDGTSTVETRGRGGKKAAAKKGAKDAPAAAAAKGVAKVGKKKAAPEPEPEEDEEEDEEAEDADGADEAEEDEEDEDE